MFASFGPFKFGLLLPNACLLHVSLSFVRVLFVCSFVRSFACLFMTGAFARSLIHFVISCSVVQFVRSLSLRRVVFGSRFDVGCGCVVCACLSVRSLVRSFTWFVLGCFTAVNRLYKPLARKPWLNGLPRACTFV